MVVVVVVAFVVSNCNAARTEAFIDVCNESRLRDWYGDCVLLQKPTDYRPNDVSIPASLRPAVSVYTGDFLPISHDGGGDVLLLCLCVCPSVRVRV